MEAKVRESRSEVFWMAFRSLSKKEQRAVLDRLLEDPEVREDHLDIALIEERRAEPARPFRDYLAETSL